MPGKSGSGIQGVYEVRENSSLYEGVCLTIRIEKYIIIGKEPEYYLSDNDNGILPVKRISGTIEEIEDGLILMNCEELHSFS